MLGKVADARADVEKVGVLDVLFGKIDVRIDPRQQFRDLFLKRARLRGEALAVQQKARAHFCLALAVDHVDEPFRRGKRELAVQKGAAGKLALFRHTAAEGERPAQNSARDARAAVTVKFHHVFARKAVRRAEKYAQPVIAERLRLDRPRIHHARREFTHGHFACGLEHFFRHGQRVVAAEADDRHPSFAGRRGNGCYATAVHCLFLNADYTI